MFTADVTGFDNLVTDLVKVEVGVVKRAVVGLEGADEAARWRVRMRMEMKLRGTVLLRKN